MEVDKNNWKQLLVPILKDIANASFVSFDLEMSGISTRPKYSAGDRSHDVGKPTLQKQYEEVKEAAETFQVLQLGITCVEEDREKGECGRLHLVYIMLTDKQNTIWLDHTILISVHSFSMIGSSI
jgi:hypothetical protein